MQRQNFASLIRFSTVLCLSLFVVMLGGLLRPEAAVQTVSFDAKTDVGTGNALVYSTYLGSGQGGIDTGRSIPIDSIGNTHVTGPGCAPCAILNCAGGGGTGTTTSNYIGRLNVDAKQASPLVTARITGDSLYIDDCGSQFPGATRYTETRNGIVVFDATPFGFACASPPFIGSLSSYYSANAGASFVSVWTFYDGIGSSVEKAHFTIYGNGSGFSLTPALAQFSQQGPKLVGTGAVGSANQGNAVSLSADGNTAIIGGPYDSPVGAVWVWTRSGGVWTQQGTKLVGSGAVGIVQYGSSVSLAADGNTAIVGGFGDNSGTGAAWVWTRTGGVWTQQGTKLVGSGAVNAQQGSSVSLSADGNTAIVGGYRDNNDAGAAWVWTRSGGVWTQQGTKLVGSGAVGNAQQGYSVSLSADGNTAFVGGLHDNSQAGAVWVWTRSGGVWTQQGTKLVGSGAVGAAEQGISVSLSADGNTVIVGGWLGGAGAAWVWTRSGGVWTQQGNKLVGSDAVGNAQQGISVSLSADGNTAIVGGRDDNSGAGATWVWTRSGGVWTQQGTKLVGSGAVGSASQGFSVSLSADGNTAIVGGYLDNGSAGAAWVFTASQCDTGSFGPKTDFGTGSGPRSVAGGDFNGDGKLDLAVANDGDATVSILLGTGTGTFGTKTDFGTGSDPLSVAVGDFNGDGKLDLAVANYGTNTVSILLGTGTGSFGAKTDFGTGSGPFSVALGDFNGDGKLDLAVANNNNSGVGTVSILLGTGTGSFGAKTDFGTGDGPSSVAVGDFNGDGKLDLAVANDDSNTVSILLGTGTGSFGAKTDFGTGISPASVAVGDFNGDGKLDLAVANFNSTTTVSILLGTGTGSFGAKTDFGTGLRPVSVALGDFNGDGKLDLAVANFSSGTVSILLGAGTGSFGAKTNFGTGIAPTGVAAGDFNGDGKLDLAVANQGSNTVSILLNTCSNTPSIDAISPAVPVRSGTDQSVVVTGSSFQQNLTVTLTFPSGASTTLSGAQIQNVTSNSFTMLTTLNASGSWSLRVNNPDGAQSNTFNFAVGSGSLISAISPPSPVASGSNQNFPVSGNGFQPNLSVSVTFPNGTGTTLSGPGQIQNVTPTSFTMVVALNATGIWRIRANNPNGGGQSNTYSFTVRAPAPAITNITPDPVTAGQPTTLTVTGSNFQSGFSASVITPGGTFDIASTELTFDSANQVRVHLSMTGTPPYDTTLNIINPDRQLASRPFHVVGSSVPAPGLSGTVRIFDGHDSYKLNGPNINQIKVSAFRSNETTAIDTDIAADGLYHLDLPQGTYRLEVEIRYKDQISEDTSSLPDGCQSNNNLEKITTIVRAGIQAPQSGAFHINVERPLVMVHGIHGCYEKWVRVTDIKSESFWDSYARNRGFITFTPNYYWKQGASHPWEELATQVKQQVENDLKGLSREITADKYPRWVYIGHSQGGLVARVLTSGANKATRIVEAIDRIYLLGTPNSGSIGGGTNLVSLLAWFTVDTPYLSRINMLTGFNKDFESFGDKNLRLHVFAGQNHPCPPGLSCPGNNSTGLDDGAVPVESVYKIDRRFYGDFLVFLVPVFSDVTIFRYPLTLTDYSHTELGSQQSLDVLAAIVGDLSSPGSLSMLSMPLVHAPTTTQGPSLSLQTVAAENRTLVSNETVTLNLTIGATDTFVVNAFPSPGSASFSLVNPSGQVIDFSTLPSYAGQHIVEAGGEIFILRNPASGAWSLRATAGQSGASITVVAAESSPLGFGGFAEPTVFSGQAAHMIGQWLGTQTGITSASISAQVLDNTDMIIATVALLDDGNHRDGVAGDGVFGGDTPVLSSVGGYSVIFKAQANLNGQAFERWAKTFLDVANPTHSFTGAFIDAAVDLDVNGVYDSLRETVGISVGTAGGYHVSADLYDAQGYFISHARGYTQAPAGGVYSVVLDFSLSGAFCSQFSAPFTLKNLTLSDAGALTVLDVYMQNVTTLTYDGTLFGCVSGTPLPSISSLQPNSMFPSGSGQVLIGGNSFQNGAQVSFGAGVSVSSVTFGSSSVLVAQVNVAAGATPGPRDVTITNPDGHSSIATALFTVASDQAPSVSINNLTNQQIINGSVTVSATASDDVEIQRVEFYVDGVLSGTDTTFPYQYLWATGAYSNGPHTFAAKAYDTVNQNSTAQVNVIVSCISGFTPSHQSFAASGGNGEITITSGCNWASTSDALWITITSGSGTGNGMVTYSLAENTASTIRNGTITVAGQTFTVYQGINFLDVPSNNPFYDDIGKLSARGVTLGCGNGNYCPNAPVLRDQMAAFILRAKGEFDPPTPASQRFNDVPPPPAGNVFYNFIDRLAELGITVGCQASPPLYCPSDPVKRDQMAAFILRGLGEFDPPTPSSQRFNDVPPSNVFYNFIDRMAVLGITLGCQASPPLYCPSDSVTRAQMAAFLVRAFNL